MHTYHDSLPNDIYKLNHAVHSSAYFQELELRELPQSGTTERTGLIPGLEQGEVATGLGRRARGGGSFTG